MYSFQGSVRIWKQTLLVEYQFSKDFKFKGNYKTELSSSSEVSNILCI